MKFALLGWEVKMWGLAYLLGLFELPTSWKLREDEVVWFESLVRVKVSWRDALEETEMFCELC